MYGRAQLSTISETSNRTMIFKNDALNCYCGLPAL